MEETRDASLSDLEADCQMRRAACYEIECFQDCINDVNQSCEDQRGQIYRRYLDALFALDREPLNIDREVCRIIDPSIDNHIEGLR